MDKNIEAIEKKRSDYSPAETQMIMCITRAIACTPEGCLKCGYLRDEVRERLNTDQAKWNSAKE